MPRKHLLAVLPALLGLACPAPGEWDEPLGPVQGGRLDSTLVGQWRCRTDGGSDAFRLAIVPFDKDQYVMTLSRLTGKDRDETFLRAYTTTVGGHDVMNVKELDDDPGDGDWWYSRFDVTQAGRLSIDLVGEEPLEGVPEDVESRRLAIGDLFESPELWVAGYRCVELEEETKAP